GEKSKIKGSVFGLQKTGNDKNRLLLSIGKETEIYGQVYCSDATDLKGTVYGNLTTNKIVLITPAAVYKNHLLNAVVDFSKLPKAFVGANLLNRNLKKD